MKTIILLSVVFFISACSMVPTPIAVDEGVALTPYQAFSKSQDPSMKLGKKARWGGKIVSVENKKDTSHIEIVVFPENRYGKPMLKKDSPGRFKAVVEGFIDPQVFEPGRLITVVGTIGSAQVGLVGEHEYTYPTLDAVGYYMWQNVTEVEIETYQFAPFGIRNNFHRSFFSPWYDPFYDRRRVRVRVRDNNTSSVSSRPTETNNISNRSAHEQHISDNK
ncbi:MAG: Slp family lipoprotein [Glaciecola sp.]